MGSPFRYCGAAGYQTSPDTGLMLAGNRWYDPAIGRFLTPDPSGSGDNPYAYCRNNPVSHLDPLGLQDGGDDPGPDDDGGGISVSISIGDTGNGIGSPSSFIAPSGTSGSSGSGSSPSKPTGLSHFSIVSNYEVAGLGMGGAPNVWADHNASHINFDQPPFDIGDYLPFAVNLSGQIAFALATEGGSLEAEGPEEIASLLGGGCFVAGTPVQMADGTTKPIEQVTANDMVLSRGEYAKPTDDTEAKPVLKAYHLRVNHTVLLTLSSGEVLETTENHPFFVFGAGWVKAGKLSIGNLLVPRAGPATADIMVSGIERKAGPATVYNLSVEDDHSYFVGTTEGGSWVHNGPADCYRDTFFNAHPELNPDDWVVHHAIEQQVLSRFPGLFTEAENNALSNLRGVSNETNGWMHLSAIRKNWNQFYTINPSPSRQDITDFAGVMDNRWGGNFVW